MGLVDASYGSERLHILTSVFINSSFSSLMNWRIYSFILHSLSTTLKSISFLIFPLYSLFPNLYSPFSFAVLFPPTGGEISLFFSLTIWEYLHKFFLKNINLIFWINVARTNNKLWSHSKYSTNFDCWLSPFCVKLFGWMISRPAPVNSPNS